MTISAVAARPQARLTWQTVIWVAKGLDCAAVADQKKPGHKGKLLHLRSPVGHADLPTLPRVPTFAPRVIPANYDSCRSHACYPEP